MNKNKKAKISQLDLKNKKENSIIPEFETASVPGNKIHKNGEYYAPEEEVLEAKKFSEELEL